MKDTPRTMIAYRAVTHDGDDCRGWTPPPGWDDLAAWINDPERTDDYPALLDFDEGIAIFSSRQTAQDGNGIAVEGTGYDIEQLEDFLQNSQLYDLDAAEEFIAWTFIPQK